MTVRPLAHVRQAVNKLEPAVLVLPVTAMAAPLAEMSKGGMASAKNHRTKTFRGFVIKPFTWFFVHKYLYKTFSSIPSIYIKSQCL